MRVRDWEAWYDDAGIRFGWIQNGEERLGAITWVGDEVTQVLGLNGDEPPEEASEAALMWVKPRVVAVYSFQPAVMAAARHQGLEPSGEWVQVRTRLEGSALAGGTPSELAAVAAGDAETVGRLYDQVYKTKGGRRVVWQFFDRHAASRGYLWRQQGRGVGLYADRVNPTHEVQVVWLGILPDARRQGLGRRLLAAAMAERARGGAAEIVAQFRSDNRGAERLAETLGFQREWTKTRVEIA